MRGAEFLISHIFQLSTVLFVVADLNLEKQSPISFYNVLSYLNEEVNDLLMKNLNFNKIKISTKYQNFYNLCMIGKVYLWYLKLLLGQHLHKMLCFGM